MALVTYSIDPEDRIREVGGEWDDFAAENDGAPAGSTRVVGTVLWDHMDGQHARQLHQTFVSAVRARGSVVVPFRCDAPDRRRYMELSARSESGWVHFTSRLVHEELRSRVEILTGAGTVHRSVDICANCRRVRTPRGWCEVEAAIQYMDLYGSESMPALRESACPDCTSTVQVLSAN